MQTLPENSVKPDRLYYIDNIRWLMIIFVVLIHAAVTYSNMGMWYYTEPSKLDVASFAFFGLYQSFTQAYSMGLLFLIAGYFTPGAFDKKGLRRFLIDRAVRLGIPTLVYMLFINPFINYYLLAFKWISPRPALGQYLMGYILGLGFLSGSGPMWFALALLIFSAVYGLFRLLPPNLLPSLLSSPDIFKTSDMGDRPIKNIHIIGLGLMITVCAFAIRLAQPIGTSWMNMQLGFFSQYIILFIVGIAVYRNKLLSRIPYPFAMGWFKVALIGGLIFWVIILAMGGGITGDLSKYSGGLYWQSAAYAIWESFFCLGISLGIIVLFRERFNRQGRFEKFMSDNYFSVYVFHPPILILISLAFVEFAWHPILKFLAVSAISLPLCFIAGHMVFRRVPVLKRVLYNSHLEELYDETLPLVVHSSVFKTLQKRIVWVTKVA